MLISYELGKAFLKRTLIENEECICKPTRTRDPIGRGDILHLGSVKDLLQLGAPCIIAPSRHLIPA